MVWANILNRIVKQNDFEIAFIDYENQNNLFRKNLILPQELTEVRKMCFKNLNRYFSPLIRYNKKFIFHSSYYRICKNKNAINVTTVHDFTYEYFRQGVSKKVHSWQKKYAIKHSDYIICISENTKRDLLKFIPCIDVRKIRIIYNGVSNDFFHIDHSPYNQYHDYVLFVGGRDNYKNFKFTVDALKDTKYKLLICGKPLSEDENKYLLKQLGVNKYKIVSGISNKELNELYNSVFCLAYPSIYEGFGIPVIEAQKSGCPVIAYNGSSIPEIIGVDYPMINNLNIKEFKHLLFKLEDKTYRNQIIKLGLTNCQRFSWDQTFHDYLKLYKEIDNSI